MKPSDHDLLIEIREAILAKDTGLKDQMTKVNVILIGNGKEGLVNRVNNHIEEHVEEKQSRTRREQRLIAFCGIIGGVISYLVSFWRK